MTALIITSWVSRAGQLGNGRCALTAPFGLAIGLRLITSPAFIALSSALGLHNRCHRPPAPVDLHQSTCFENALTDIRQIPGHFGAIFRRVNRNLSPSEIVSCGMSPVTAPRQLS